MLLLLVIGLLPGLGACARSCTAYEYSIASGATGAATASEALSAWLLDAPPGFTTDPSAWTATSNDATVYSDGTGRITVTRVDGTATGYFVTSAHTCDE